MKKMSDKQYIWVSGVSGFVEIGEGKPRTLTIEGHDIDCVMCKPEPGHEQPYTWVVIEQETGKRAGGGRTMKEALAQAQERLTTEITQLGYEEFRAQYFTGKKASPRYGGGVIS